MMEDFTKECLETSRVDGKNLSEKDLRSLFCKQCKNYKCGHAKWKRPSWEERMENQEERLLNNPNFGDPNSSKWESLREIDFPDLVKKALLLEAADRKGDWSLPSVFEAFDPSIDEKKPEPKSEPKSEPKPEENPVPEITEIKIKSNSKDTVYTVTLEDGKAVSCTCSAGIRKRKCSHLQEAEKSYVMEGFKKEEKGKEEKGKDEDEKVEFPIIQLTQEEKRELGGIHLIKNSSCDPHGIMVGGDSKPVPNTPKKKEDPWERKEKEKVVKPGTVIKL